MITGRRFGPSDGTERYDFTIWHAFGNDAWPAKYLFDDQSAPEISRQSAFGETAFASQ